MEAALAGLDPPLVRLRRPCKLVKLLCRHPIASKDPPSPRKPTAAGQGPGRHRRRGGAGGGELHAMLPAGLEAGGTLD